MQEIYWGGGVTGKAYSLAARGLFDAPTVASTDGDERSVRVLEADEGSHAKESRTRVHAGESCPRAAGSSAREPDWVYDGETGGGCAGRGTRLNETQRAGVVTKTAEALALLSALAAVSALAAASGTTIDTFDHITSNFIRETFAASGTTIDTFGHITYQTLFAKIHTRVSSRVALFSMMWAARVI